MNELWMFAGENADALSRGDSESYSVLTLWALLILWTRNGVSAA